MPSKNRQFRLKTRPTGMVSKDNFEYREEVLPEVKSGQALIRNLYLSLDPTNRIWMSDMPQYMPPVQIGEVMRGLGIGQVLASKNPQFKEGDYVSGLLGWQDYLLTEGKEALPLSVLPNIPGLPVSVFAGAAGLTGWTAYFGLLDIGQPKQGETLVVSAAAGAVGSIVGQIGKLHGLKVVGIAGGAEKCHWLTNDLGFDAAVDYKSPNWQEELIKATPNGVDINFENVGGEIMNAVFNRMNLHGRMVVCGFISAYNDSDQNHVQISLAQVLMKRLKVQGFIITDYADKIPEATGKLVQWIAQGKIKYKETIVDGLENAPTALNKLFDGGNTGKLLVKVADV
jgi:NADPH-dependent curcumin reductase CurA